MTATSVVGERATSTVWQTPTKVAALVVALAGAILLGAANGPVPVPFETVAGIILSNLHVPVTHTWSASQAVIVWDIRMPEVMTAVLVGAALALSGVIFQAVLRNPLADPFVIGTSSGAAFAVALVFWLWAGPAVSVVWLGFGLPQVFAFGGALLSVALVFALTYTTRRSGSLTVLLAGFAVSTLMIAGMWLSAYESGRETLLFGWMMGSLSNSSWTQLELVGPIIVVLSLAAVFLIRDLNALLLGEEQASYLGLGADSARIRAILLATLLTALAVSLAGIIGFVGLVIPHIGRLLYGSNHRILIPTATCLGAIFLVLCDVLARTLVGSGELPLGIITAIIGAPVFLVFLLRAGNRYAF